MREITNNIIKKRNKYNLYIIAVIFFVIISLGYIGYRFVKHEYSQNAYIKSLQNQINELKLDIDSINNNLIDYKIVWKEDSYKYLAIGNSITKHPINEYWWNEIGMAASTLDNDYVHVFVSMLTEDIEQVDVKTTNLVGWEASCNDRGEFLESLDSYLFVNLDLITIQLGENVTDTTNLESDFEELIRYIQDKCPNARIVVIGQYWKDDTKDEDKKQACINTGVDFVDLSSMFDKEDSIYNAGMGTIVYDADENEHIIEREGVAKHPGDEGMKEIARLVYEAYIH